MASLIVNKKHLLLKMQGKGGWTYTLVEGVDDKYKGRGGLVKVSGTIDGYELKEYNMFPMKNKPGTYFMPVKGTIRKVIKKEEGDMVHLVLYALQEQSDVREEFLLCLDDNPEAKKAFQLRAKHEQEALTNWVCNAKSEDAKVGRILKVLVWLETGFDFKLLAEH